MTSNIHDDFLRVLELSSIDERHLVAHELYLQSLERLQQVQNSTCMMRSNSDNDNDDDDRLKSISNNLKGLLPSHRLKARKRLRQMDTDELEKNSMMKQHVEAAAALLRDKKQEFDEVIKLANEVNQAKENLMNNEDWIYAQTFFGISTFYRHEHDGSLSVKLEGEMSGVSLFEQFCVLHEIDLYNLWVPFCTSSTKLRKIRQMGSIAYSKGSIPLVGITRDVVFRAVACDCIKENGCIVISAVSIDEYPGVTIPPEPKGFGSARMIARDFQAIIEVISPRWVYLLPFVLKLYVIVSKKM